MQGRACRGLQGRFIRPLMESITRELPALVALDPCGRVYLNLPYLKDLVDRVEARELPLEEALEDGRKPPKSPARQGRECS